jgi:hypothetical protein
MYHGLSQRKKTEFIQTGLPPKENWPERGKKDCPEKEKREGLPDDSLHAHSCRLISC